MLEGVLVAGWVPEPTRAASDVRSAGINRASRDARLMPAIRTSLAARVGSGTHPATKTSAGIPIYVF